MGVPLLSLPFLRSTCMASKNPSLTDGKSGLKVFLYSPTPPAAKMTNRNASYSCTPPVQMSKTLFHTFTETGTNYKTAVDKLNQYFAPRKNTSYNGHIFRQEKQKEGETISQFVTRLQQLAIFCDFPAESIDSFIQDQVIDNCSSTKLRTKLLAERGLTLDRMLDIRSSNGSFGKPVASNHRGQPIYQRVQH